MHGIVRKQEVSVAFLQSMSHTVSRGVVPLIFNVSGRWRWVVIFTPRQPCSQERRQYP